MNAKTKPQHGPSKPEPADVLRNMCQALDRLDPDEARRVVAAAAAYVKERKD